MKKLWRVLAGVAVAATVVAAPLIAAPAMADEMTDSSAVAAAEGPAQPEADAPTEVPGDAPAEAPAEVRTPAGTEGEPSAPAEEPVAAVAEAEAATEAPAPAPAPAPAQAPAQARTAAVTDAQVAAAEERKVVVCKYVSTPDVRERLQVVIEPSVNALGSGFTGTFPYAFNDAQSKSIAIGYADTGLTIADCPAPEVVPVPTVFSANPAPPTCDDPGALPTLGTFAHVTLTWDRAFDGPGTYTLTATAIEGYTFPDGTTVKTVTFVVAGAIGYQSEDPEAPCYRAEEPIEVSLTTPSIHDVCGTEDDSAELPEASTGVTYEWLDDDDPTELDVVATVADGYEVSTVPDGWEPVGDGTFVYAQADLTNVPCPAVLGEPPVTTPPASTPPMTVLPATGGGSVPPLLPFGAAATLLVGIAATAAAAARRRA